MRNFIKNICLFSFLALVSLNLLEYFLPYHYGNKSFTAKLVHLEKNGSKFNTVFFGSSHTDFSVSPTIIDSILVKENVKSFNFGVGGTSNPESYYLVEEFIKNIDSSQYKLFMLEVSPIRNMSLSNFKTTRNCYYHSTKELNYSLSIIDEEDYSIKDKSKLTFKYCLHYLKNKINFSKLSYLRTTYFDIEKKSKSYNGFTSTIINRTLIDSEKDYQQKKETSYVLESIKNIKTSLNSHAERLNEIHQKCKQKGIKLFFLVQPKNKGYIFMNNLRGKLPEGSLINFASAKQFPQFYNEEYSIDSGHLNLKGAIIFSKLLGLEMKRRLNKK